VTAELFVVLTRRNLQRPVESVFSSVSDRGRFCEGLRQS